MIIGKNIQGAIRYNEHKVMLAKAECIMAVNFFSNSPDELSLIDKFKQFEALTRLNLKVKTNTLHISLNFDVSEKIDREKLCQISSAYMEKIGFGHQPYLVYEHFDAAHQHVHLVTTNIQRNAKRIDLHNIGRNKSEPARKSIETSFGLVRAESKKKNGPDLIDPIDIRKAVYGKSETKRSISNILNATVRTYKYTSLTELNAVLRQFNIVADRGKEGTLIYDKMGLRYSLLDERGEKIGVPIKASSIYGNPTLPYLEKQFKLNERLRQPYKDRLIRCIDKSFAGKKTITRAAFEKTLSAESIYTLFRQNEEGRIYGITFVDNKTKVVFNGSDLGKGYGAKAITERLSNLSAPSQISIQPKAVHAEPESLEQVDSEMTKMIKDLVEAKQYDFTSPDSAMKRRKRRKKRGRSI